MLVGVSLALSFPALGQGLQALARVDLAESAIRDERAGGVDITLRLSQPVPFRVFTLKDPVRLVMDFKEVDWQGFDPETITDSENVIAVRFGLFRPGWSRLVLGLDHPVVVRSAALLTSDEFGHADLRITLDRILDKEFPETTGSLEDDAWALPKVTTVQTAKTRQLGDRQIIVAIDPGHGGIDPGANNLGYFEKDLTLQFARELKEGLVRSGRYQAFLVRESDVFMSLAERVLAARNKSADVFISLHADALKNGTATGTTVYTLSEKASDAAAGELAARHNRDELLAGVDLSDQDDQIAQILMDMARIETDARSKTLAGYVVHGIAKSIGRMRKRPHLGAGFSVLKAPDIPSILIELGFISNKSDLSNLLTVHWREQIVNGILQGLDAWVVEDAAQARLLRQ